MYLLDWLPVYEVCVVNSAVVRSSLAPSALYPWNNYKLKTDIACVLFSDIDFNSFQLYPLFFIQVARSLTEFKTFYLNYLNLSAQFWCYHDTSMLIKSTKLNELIIYIPVNTYDACFYDQAFNFKKKVWNIFY